MFAIIILMVAAHEIILLNFVFLTLSFGELSVVMLSNEITRRG